MTEREVSLEEEDGLDVISIYMYVRLHRAKFRGCGGANLVRIRACEICWQQRSYRVQASLLWWTISWHVWPDQIRVSIFPCSS